MTENEVSIPSTNTSYSAPGEMSSNLSPLYVEDYFDLLPDICLWLGSDSVRKNIIFCYINSNQSTGHHLF